VLPTNLKNFLPDQQKSSAHHKNVLTLSHFYFQQLLMQNGRVRLSKPVDI
jgi:hypothetical protein